MSDPTTFENDDVLDRETQDLLDQFESQVGQEAQEPPPESPAEEPPVHSEGESQQDEPVADETYTIGGVTLSREQAEGLVEFYEWGRHNPQHLAAFDAYLSGQAEFVPRSAETPPPQGEAPSPPEEDDIDWDDLDPGVAKRLRRLEELEQGFQSLTQEQQSQRVATARAVVRKASENFASRFDLSEQDLEMVMQSTAQLGILPGLAEQSGDSIAAVEEALETAYWRTPELRQREVEKRVQAEVSDAQRRRKASALSGSSGSIPRSDPEQTNPRDRMVAEIKQAMHEGTIPGA